MLPSPFSRQGTVVGRLPAAGCATTPAAVGWTGDKAASSGFPRSFTMNRASASPSLPAWMRAVPRRHASLDWLVSPDVFAHCATGRSCLKAPYSSDRMRPVSLTIALASPSIWHLVKDPHDRCHVNNSQRHITVILTQEMASSQIAALAQNLHISLRGLTSSMGNVKFA